jgi:hypothetical protein
MMCWVEVLLLPLCFHQVVAGININLSSVAVEIEPVKTLTFQSGLSYRTLESASPFSLDYYTDAGQTVTKSTVNQSEVNFQVSYTPNRKRLGTL